jgi:hypothetical protein
MAAPPAYLDECINYHLAALLLGRGFDVRHVYDVPQMIGRDDDQQLEHATLNQWVFVSQNQWEFNRRHQAWRQQGRQHAGLILVPQCDTPILEIRVALLLDWLSAWPPALSPLVRWCDLQPLLARGYRVNRMYAESEIHRAIGWLQGNAP